MKSTYKPVERQTTLEDGTGDRGIAQQRHGSLTCVSKAVNKCSALRINGERRYSSLRSPECDSVAEGVPVACGGDLVWTFARPVGGVGGS